MTENYQIVWIFKKSMLGEDVAKIIIGRNMQESMNGINLTKND